MTANSGVPIDGILLIDKEQGWTSHDVVAKARRITGQRRIGHTGTLDPMATGLLVLCLGHATRLVEYMTDHDKRYEGEITLGVTTDTDDAEGTLLAQREVPAIADEDLRELEQKFTGELMQLPPAYSAIKVDGRRAYAVARGGERPAVQARPVTVHALELERLGTATLATRVHCGAGTYIRSLARDMGEALGCGAHLSALRRTEVGGFRIADAVTLSELETLVGAGMLGDLLLAPDEGVRDRATAVVSAEHAERLSHGLTLEAQEAVGACDAARIYTADGRFVAIGSIEAGGRIRPVKVFESASSS